MKIRTEKGWIYSKGYKREYTEHYTQPWWNYWIAKIYYNYAYHTFKFWYLVEKFEGKYSKKAKAVDWENELIYVPLTNRQDLRHFDLAHKNRKRIETQYGPEVPYGRKAD